MSTPLAPGSPARRPVSESPSLIEGTLRLDSLSRGLTSKAGSEHRGFLGVTRELYKSTVVVSRTPTGLWTSFRAFTCPRGRTRTGRSESTEEGGSGRSVQGQKSVCARGRCPGNVSDPVDGPHTGPSRESESRSLSGRGGRARFGIDGTKGVQVEWNDSKRFVIPDKSAHK